MILFFHILCLLGRYFITNVSRSFTRGKFFRDHENANASIEEQFSDILSEPKNYIKHPVYEDGTLKFFPPVYIQRYETVTTILENIAWRWNIRKVVDFGCSELSLFRYLKNIDGVTEILEVDIDKDILERNSRKAAPLISDYLMGKREKPLDVYVLAGSIADYDDHLIGCDALVAIELIEHLSKEDFEKMPYNVFCKIKPKIAIFTTPNADFNSLFPNFKDLRHEDHKFEWTRREFCDWAQQILKLYPEYSVKFCGIGIGPEGSENLGCCTQMAVFIRADNFENFLSAREKSEDICNYEVVQHYKYPLYVDSRSTEEKILHEIQFQVPHLSSLDTYYNYEKNESEIPLSLLIKFVSNKCSGEEELVNILKNHGINLRQKNNDWFLVHSELESNASDITSECDDWINEKIPEAFYYKDDMLVNDNFWDDKELESENITEFQSARNVKELNTTLSETEKSLDKVNQEYISLTKNKIKPISQSYDQLPQFLKSVEPSNDLKLKNKERKTCSPVKSGIPRLKNKRYDDCSRTNFKETELAEIGKPFKKICKSRSLDSCLENENETHYWNLIPGEPSSSNVDGSPSYAERKHVKNFSGSSLLSKSLGIAGDSGYPISFSLPDDNLNPEHVDEFFTENDFISRSTSSSTEIEMISIINRRLHEDGFFKNLVLENGDLAKNDRDGKGNNAEGLMGQRLINEVATETNSNDDLFFPVTEVFPPWLLNLGELVLRPVYFPLNDSDSNEGVKDDLSCDLNHSLDLEDIDIDFREPSNG